MRVLGKEEQAERGCIYCNDCRNVKVPDLGKRGKTLKHCIHNECPYNEEHTEDAV